MAVEKLLSAPAETPPRIAPTWLRLLALVGVGLVLAAAPLLEGARGWLPGHSADPRKTAEDFLVALRDKDSDTMKDLLVPPARHSDFVALRLPAPLFWLPYLTYEVRAAKSSGQNVAIPFTVAFQSNAVPSPRENAQVRKMLLEQARRLDGSEGVVLLQWDKAEARWLVFGVGVLEKDTQRPGIPLPDQRQRATTYDFTSSLPELLQALQSLVLKQKQPAFDALAAHDARPFAAAWQMDGTVQDRPAREVLERALGLKLSVAGADRDALAGLGKRVTLNLKGRSRLDAAEEVCRQAGLHPRYTKAGLVPERGPRLWPVAVAGPFLLEVMAVQEVPANDRAVVKLRCLSAGLPQGVLAVPRTPGKNALGGVWYVPGSGAVFLPRPVARAVRVDRLKVTVPGGGDVAMDVTADFTVPVSDIFKGVQAGTAAGAPAQYGFAQVHLTDLPANLDTLPRLAGRVRMAQPRVEEFRFEPLTDGMGSNGAETRWVLRELGGQPRVLVLDGTGVAGRYLLWTSYDGAGKPLHFGETALVADGPQPLLVTDAAKALVLKVVGPVVRNVDGPGEQFEYPFEVRDIPLKRGP